MITPYKSLNLNYMIIDSNQHIRLFPDQQQQEQHKKYNKFIQKLKIFVFIIIGVIAFTFFVITPNLQLYLPNQKLQLMQQIIKGQANIVQYSANITKYEHPSKKELSLCVLIQQQHLQQQVYASIMKQQYENYKVVLLMPKYRKWRVDISEYSHLKPYFKIFEYFENFDPWVLKGRMCEWTDILYYPQGQLQSKALWSTNKQFQSSDIWAITTEYHINNNQHKYGLLAFYASLLSDLQQTLQQSLTPKTKQLFHKIDLFMSITQLSQRHLKKQTISLSYGNLIQSTLITAWQLKSVHYVRQFINKRRVYSPKVYLNDLAHSSTDDNIPINNNPIGTNFQEQLNTQNLLHLNINHTLHQHHRTTKFPKYPLIKQQLSCSKQPPQKQTNQLCLIVYCYNQEQTIHKSSFYFSLRNQLQSNFHVVFVDDKSDDLTNDVLKKRLLEFDAAFKKHIISNPNHLGKLMSFNFVMRNNLCADNQFAVFTDITDIMASPFTVGAINSGLTEQAWGARIKRLNVKQQKISDDVFAFRVSLLKHTNLFQKLSHKSTTINMNIAFEAMAKLCKDHLVQISDVNYLDISQQQHIQINEEFEQINKIINGEQFLQNYSKDIQIMHTQSDWQLGDTYDTYKGPKFATRDNQQRPILNFSIFNTQSQIQQLRNSIYQTAQYKDHEPLVIAKAIWEHRNEEKYQVLQYYHYDEKYRISEDTAQRKICIVGGQYNMLKQKDYTEFLESVARQNYTNYRVIIIDDASNDGSAEVLKEAIKDKFPILESKLILIRQHHNVGSFKSKVLGARHCDIDSILFDVDSDDVLPGKQTFNVINKLYADNPDKWFIYSNHVTLKEHGQISQGYSRQILPDVLLGNKYRYDRSWRTGHLKTMYTKLFMKIDQIPEKQNRMRAADRIIMYGIVELAGPQHVLFVKDYFYLYYYTYQTECDHYSQINDEYHYRNRKPYFPLANLDESPAINEEFQIPQEVLLGYQKAQKDYQDSLQRRYQQRINQKICYSDT